MQQIWCWRQCIEAGAGGKASRCKKPSLAAMQTSQRRWRFNKAGADFDATKPALTSMRRWRRSITVCLVGINDASQPANSTKTLLAAIQQDVVGDVSTKQALAARRRFNKAGAGGKDTTKPALVATQQIRRWWQGGDEKSKRWRRCSKSSVGGDSTKQALAAIETGCSGGDSTKQALTAIQQSRRWRQGFSKPELASMH